MKLIWKYRLSFIIVFSLVLICFISFFNNNKELIESRRSLDYDKLYLKNHFSPNKGTFPDSILYYAKIKGGLISLSNKGIINYKIKNKNGSLFTFSEQICQKSIDPIPVDTIIFNYVKGNPEKWKKQYKHKKLYIGEIQSGVKLYLACNDGNIEKIFIVNNSISLNKLIIKLTDLDSVNSSENNELMLYLDGDSLSFTSPKSYLRNNPNLFYETSYTVYDNYYCFNIPTYTNEDEIVIDPLFASSLLGGSNGFEKIMEIYEEENGEYTVIGTTDSDDFPIIGNTIDQSFNSLYGTDIFIARFDSLFDNLIKATYFGGNWNDNLNDVTRDQDRNIIICGSTGSDDFPVSQNAWCNSLNGNYFTGYISIISKELDQLIASTYGTERTRFDHIRLIAEKIFVAGFIIDSTEATYNFSENSYNSNYSGDRDIFLLKFNNDLTQRLSGTYVGTSGWDELFGLFDHTDSTIGIFGQISGMLESESEPLFQYNGNKDAFVGVLDTSLNKMYYFTPIGGGLSWDKATRIQKWENGDYFITGKTNSNDFPLFGSNLPNSNSWLGDVFLASFNNNFSNCYFTNRRNMFSSGITWINRNSYYIFWGASVDTMPGIDSTSFSNEFYGWVDSIELSPGNWFIIEHWDTYIAKVFDTLNNQIVNATYFGGNGDEFGWDRSPIINSKGNLVFSGSTSSTDYFPFTNHGFDTTYNGGVDYEWMHQGDAYIAILDSNLSADTNQTIINDLYSKYKVNIQVFPNPFKQFANINISVLNSGFYQIKLFDIHGKLQKVVFNDYLYPGNYTFQMNKYNWRNEELKEGYYIFVLITHDYKQTLKLIKI